MMSDELKAPSEIDLEHLRLLSLFFYISGVITAVIVSFFLFHFVVFGAMAVIPNSAWDQQDRISASATQSGAVFAPTPIPNAKSEPPPKILFGIFAAVIGVVILVGWTIGGLTIYAGRCIKKRKHYVFVIVMSAIKCIFIPYGTLLGVLSLIVMTKPHIKRLFYTIATSEPISWPPS